MFFTNPVLLLAALGSGATQFVTYGLGNFVSLFLMREKGMTLDEVAVWYALVVAIGMGGGILVSGPLIDRFIRRSRAFYALLPAASLTLAVPFYLGFVWSPGWQLALVFLLGPMLLNYFYLSAAVALVQEEVRPDQRVMSGALLLLIMNFIGLGLGPTYVGAASDYFHAQPPRTFAAVRPVHADPGLWRRHPHLPRPRARAPPRVRIPSRSRSVTPVRLLIAAALATLATPSVAAPEPIVAAPAGTVRGTREGDIAVFKGIPFAAPPVGALRWKPPVAAPRWAGVRDATAFGPACVQPDVKTPNLYSWDAPLPQSEDCLSLNVWAPADARARRRCSSGSTAAR